MKVSKLILFALFVMAGLLQSCKKDALTDTNIQSEMTSQFSGDLLNATGEKTLLVEDYTIFEGYSTQPGNGEILLPILTEVPGVLELADDVNILKDTKAMFKTTESGMVKISGSFKAEKGAFFSISKENKAPKTNTDISTA